MIEIMPYRRYKQSYADCTTIPGSYDAISKTIKVEIPAGRMKASGVRGQRYLYLTFTGLEIATGRKVSCTIKATCEKTHESGSQLTVFGIKSRTRPGGHEGRKEQLP